MRPLSHFLSETRRPLAVTGCRRAAPVRMELPPVRVDGTGT